MQCLVFFFFEALAGCQRRKKTKRNKFSKQVEACCRSVAERKTPETHSKLYGNGKIFAQPGT